MTHLNEEWAETMIKNLLKKVEKLEADVFNVKIKSQKEKAKYPYIVGDWEETPEGLVVDGYVDFGNSGKIKMKTLPVKFKSVSGDFKVWSLGLTSFENFPETIGGNARMCQNKFEGYKDFPKEIGGELTIMSNWGKTKYTKAIIKKICNVRDGIHGSDAK